MPLTLSVTTAPTVEPLGLTEAKAHLRVDNDDENALIESLIETAREQVENDTRRALMTQTLRLNLDAFPCDTDTIQLPRPPLVSVSSITYVDSAGTTQTWASSNYIVDAASEPGRVVLAYNASWPTARAQANAIAINYVAGWTAATLPAAAKRLVALWVAHLFELREPVNVGNIVNEIPLAIKTLTARLSIGDYR